MHIEACIGQPYNRIILYRSTRDHLICSHAIEKWARVGCNGRSRARLLPARRCTCKPGSASGNKLYL